MNQLNQSLVVAHLCCFNFSPSYRCWDGIAESHSWEPLSSLCTPRGWNNPSYPSLLFSINRALFCWSCFQVRQNFATRGPSYSLGGSNPLFGVERDLVPEKLWFAAQLWHSLSPMLRTRDSTSTHLSFPVWGLGRALPWTALSKHHSHLERKALGVVPGARRVPGKWQLLLMCSVLLPNSWKMGIRRVPRSWGSWAGLNEIVHVMCQARSFSWWNC